MNITGFLHLLYLLYIEDDKQDDKEDDEERANKTLAEECDSAKDSSDDNDSEVCVLYYFTCLAV